MFVPLQIMPKGTADLTHADTPLTLSTLLSFPFRRQRSERDTKAHRCGNDQQRGGAGQDPAHGQWTGVPPQTGGQSVSVPLPQPSNGPTDIPRTTGTFVFCVRETTFTAQTQTVQRFCNYLTFCYHLHDTYSCVPPLRYL